VINDTYDEWRGDVRLLLRRGDDSKLLESEPTKVEALGRQILTLKFVAPSMPADCTLVAELQAGGEDVCSLRDFKVTK
jgi:hypothetical protein